MPSQWEPTARLVRRTGFGASGAEVDATLRVGPARFVATLLAADPSADPGAKATPAPHFADTARSARRADRAEKKQRK